MPAALDAIAQYHTAEYHAGSVTGSTSNERNQNESEMKTHAFFILMALAERDLHGSAIVREVLALTEGELRLWPATLYGTLAELVGGGWIAELEDPGDRPEGASARHRIYQLERSGRAALRAEVERLEGVVVEAKRRVAVT